MAKLPREMEALTLEGANCWILPCAPDSPTASMRANLGQSLPPTLTALNVTDLSANDFFLNTLAISPTACYPYASLSLRVLWKVMRRKCLKSCHLA